MALPYEKYSWNFSQHAITLQPQNLFSLLSAASLFEGKRKFSSDVNSELQKQGILTANIRNGKPDAWRDYQQILAETGLICSTKLKKDLHITEAGRLLLSGEIGFSELMTIQALRYQYPNGLKTSFIEQQINKGVLIKPAILILRILIELYKQGNRCQISIDQCQNYLINITQHDNWFVAFDSIKKNPVPTSTINKHTRRNIQDWFKFLDTTDIFVLIKDGKYSYISLSQKAQDNIHLMEELCQSGEDPRSFWIPEAGNKNQYMTWFFEFGRIPINYFKLLDAELDEEYITQNFYGASFNGADDENIEQVSGKINLKEIPSQGIPLLDPVDLTSLEVDKKISSGFIKRREKTKLHDEIVNLLARYYSNKGYKVYDDRQSIDLAVEFNSSDISIFEIKTATLRNIYPRSRLAVGQITEYGYRYSQDFGVNPQKNIVFNVDMNEQIWIKEYINEYLEIGLISVLGDEHKLYLPSNCGTGISSQV